MQNRLFRGVLGCLGWALVACAESAVEDELDRDSDVGNVGEDPDAGPNGDGDNGDSKLDAGPPRDTGRPNPRDGDSSVGDAGRRDAGPVSGLDSGTRNDAGAVVNDAGTGAGNDAGKPVVDAGPPPMTCSGSTTQCGGACVDTKTDNQHCGGCGMQCSNGQVCGDGKCAAQPVVPAGCSAKTFENRAYLFCTTTRSWTDARRSCIEAKMDLAQLGNDAETNFVATNGDSWFGANDLGSERTWVLPTPGNAQENNGTRVTYTRWAANEPNNTERCDGVDIFISCLGRRSDEDCGMLNANGRWNDADCDNRLKYVCEAY